MTVELVTSPEWDDVDTESRYLQWTSVITGALAATALSLILVTFAATIGLGVSSTAPTWRDASVALWLLSGLYLILQAVLSFGFGGYIAGRMRRPIVGQPEEVESRDGLHGLAVWALAVVLGAGLAALIGAQKAFIEKTRLIVVCPDNLRRIFEVTRLDSIVSVVGSLPEALVA